MKSTKPIQLAALLAAFAAAVPLLSANGGEEYPELPRRITGETDEARAERMAWWRHDRFGMFIHFGLYSVAARHEWVKSLEYIPDEEYDSKYFSRFDPDLLDANGILYFIVSHFIPETKGKTLEELEHLYEGKNK